MHFAHYSLWIENKFDLETDGQKQAEIFVLSGMFCITSDFSGRKNEYLTLQFLTARHTESLRWLKNIFKIYVSGTASVDNKGLNLMLHHEMYSV